MVSEGLFIGTVGVLLTAIGWIIIILFKYKDRIIKSEENNEQIKSNYNKLKKEYIKSDKKAKFPEFPSSGKLTKPLEKLFNEFNINPFNS